MLSLEITFIALWCCSYSFVFWTVFRFSFSLGFAFALWRAREAFPCRNNGELASLFQHVSREKCVPSSLSSMLTTPQHFFVQDLGSLQLQRIEEKKGMFEKNTYIFFSGFLLILILCCCSNKNNKNNSTVVGARQQKEKTSDRVWISQ